MSAHGGRWGRVATAAFLVVLLFPLTRMGCELLEFKASAYPTYAAAIADGAVARGRMPSFVPPSSVAIREVHAVDGTAEWLAFEAPADAADELADSLRAMTLAEARRTGVNRPWRVGPGWPVELARIAIRNPRDRAHLALVRSADRAYCLAIERPQGRVFAWRCDAGEGRPPS